VPKITDLMLKNLRPDGRRRDILEGEGFGVRVSERGTISFVWFYRRDGRLRRLTLGRYPAMTLGEARTAWRKARDARDVGRDPAADKRQREARVYSPEVSDPGALTFGQLASAFLERCAARQHGDGGAEARRSLERDVLPAWGALPAAAIRRADVRALVERVADRAPVYANRLLARIGRVYRWAMENDLVEASPVIGVRPVTPERSRDRTLTDAELLALWHALPAIPATDPTRIALKFALTTGQRIGEVTALPWSELDLKASWWTLPGERAKNGVAHRVPLSPLALDLLEQARKVGAGSEYVFPGWRTLTRQLTGGPIDHRVAGHALRRARAAAADVKIPKRCNPDRRRALEAWRAWATIPPFTPHDLRRTCASRLGEMGFPRETIAAVLNHTDGSVTRIYDRYSRDAEKRAALDRWAARLLEIVGGA